MQKMIYFLTALLVGGCLNLKAQEGVTNQHGFTSDAEYKSFLEEFEMLEAARIDRITRYSIENNVPIVSYDESNELVVLKDISIFGTPVFESVYNGFGVATIEASAVYPSGSTGPGVTGAGVTAAIWDGGYVLQNHVDLVNKITLGNDATGNSSHGTHVGGTIIGTGTGDSRYRGVAYGGSLKSYDFSQDTSEILNYLQNSDMKVSNHSYGRDLSRGFTIEELGKYDSTSNFYDALTNTYKYWLPVVSAGNDNGRNYNTNDGGYDLLTDKSLAKNVLTIGAVDGVFFYNSPADVSIASFSSWGPTDDGRIKPDIVAKGTQVRSPDIDGSDASNFQFYGIKSGTSMSSPMVSGGIMLLQELAFQPSVYDAYLTSASVKALILSTTKEAGSDDGPDYKFGWGLMNVNEAAQVLLDLGSTTELREQQLNSSNMSFTTTVTSNQPKLEIALVWTDDNNGPNNSNAEDDPTPMIVNDLDVVVTDTGNNQFFPWKLNPALPFRAATKGINDVDNVEIVEIDNPSGDYTVTVTIKGALFQGLPQDYSLLINGADVGTLSSGPSFNIADSIKMYPNPATTELNIAVGQQLTGKDIQVKIYDTLGKLVMNNLFDNTNAFEQRIDISTLQSGIYLVNIGDGNSSTTKKLIVK
ncbi:MAG: S8/S53 family peptidase [Nonlabens sp.]